MTLRLGTGTSGLLNKQWGKTIIKSGWGGGGGGHMFPVSQVKYVYNVYYVMSYTVIVFFGIYV